jgi:hypothetical protein
MTVQWELWSTGFEKVKFYYLICEKIEYSLADKTLFIKIVEHGCAVFEQGCAITDTSKIEAALAEEKAVPIVEHNDSKHWEVRFKNVSSFRVEDESFFSYPDVFAEESENEGAADICSCYIIQESKWFENFWIKPKDEFYPMKIYGICTAHDILHIMVPDDEEPVVSQLK